MGRAQACSRAQTRRRAQKEIHDDLGDRDQAPVRSRPTSTASNTSPTWAFRGSIRSRAACSPQCIAGGCGRCASTRALAPPRNRTSRYRYLFEQGQTGLSVAFDLPTQMGRDSDHPLAAGEVGRVGVSIGSLADMEMLLDGLPLDKISTSMTINATASILLALYLVAAERREGWMGQGQRHDPERSAQGIYRARNVHLSAARLDADYHGYF